MVDDRRGEPWTPIEVDRLIGASIAKRSANAIAEMLGRTIEAVQDKARKLGHPVFRDPNSPARPKKSRPMQEIYVDPPNVTQRKCLCCGREFASQGFHNRMCENCRRKT